MQVWCGLADSKEAARGCLAPVMQAYYQLPFERFERYCPYGTAEDIAEFLTPYVAAGCAERPPAHLLRRLGHGQAGEERDHRRSGTSLADRG